MKNPYTYSNTNKRYYALDYFYKQKFGKKVFKVSLNGGFTCPNKDGTKGYGGCIYCSKSGSGDFAGDLRKDLVTQFEEGKEILHKKWKDAYYIGYFQANTNTYASVDLLKEKYETILKQDNVVGLSIATRPDAISDECLEYLDELNKRTYLNVELGLQTIHKETTKLINRGHDLACFETIVKKLRKKNIPVIVHIINGLPYETKEMMIETAKYLNKIDIQGIKIHMLHIIKNTELEKMYSKEKFHILTKEEYIDITCCQIENLKENIVIHRLTGDPVKEDLIEPEWVLKKVSVLDDIDKELEKRRTYQGFNSSILNRVRERLDYYLKPNSLAIDATVGNGKDTAYIANIIKDGKVFGFDIQQQAIKNTKENTKQFDNVILYQESHSNMINVLPNYIGKISIILFNLGYLPKGDKTITTQKATTIKALEDSLKLIHDHGVILVTVYKGHEEGLEENNALLEWLKDKNYQIYHNDENILSPYLVEIKK